MRLCHGAGREKVFLNQVELCFFKTTFVGQGCVRVKFSHLFFVFFLKPPFASTFFELEVALPHFFEWVLEV